MSLNVKNFERELQFMASRSSGAGGQNVNKVNTKIELRFNVKDSEILSDEEKEIIFAKLEKRISNDGYLIIKSQSSRSQLKNKQETIEKFYRLISSSLTKAKKRKKTKPSLASKTRRLDKKRNDSIIKKNRKKIGIDE
jgi:ribosome-associated protein